MYSSKSIVDLSDEEKNQGEWTCTVADFAGSMKGAMTIPDGSVVPAMNKGFNVDFCTVAHRNENGEIVEENLYTISWVC